MDNSLTTLAVHAHDELAYATSLATGSRLNRPSFASAARALGCGGITVENPGELGAAFAMALAADRPTVVDVRVDPASTPIHGYRRRLAEGGSHPRPGSTYELPPWRISPEKIAGDDAQ